MNVNWGSKNNVESCGMASKKVFTMMDALEYQTSTLELTVAGNTITITNYPTYLVPKLIEDFVNACERKGTLYSLGPTG
jgi:hypothetical protein